MVARKAMMCLLANEEEYEDGIGVIADGFSLDFVSILYRPRSTVCHHAVV